jgi:hypothetical protein
MLIGARFSKDGCFALNVGELPSDELLTRLLKFQTLGLLDDAVDEIVIPTAVREAVETVISPSTTALTSAGVLPLMNSLVGTLDQIPLLIKEV